MYVTIGLLVVAIGALLLMTGYKIARIIIPIWGFIAGLLFGGGIIANMSDTPFLGSVLGVSVGLLLGAVLGVLAYLYYAACVVVLASLAGYWLGSSLILLLGVHPGLLSAFAGLVTGLLVGLVAVLARAPRAVLIIMTSLAGALTIVSGLLVSFKAVPFGSLGQPLTQATITNSSWWVLLILGLAVVGMVVQQRSTSTQGGWMQASSGYSDTWPGSGPTRSRIR